MAEATDIRYSEIVLRSYRTEKKSEDAGKKRKSAEYKFLDGNQRAAEDNSQSSEEQNSIPQMLHARTSG